MHLRDTHQCSQCATLVYCLGYLALFLPLILLCFFHRTLEVLAHLMSCSPRQDAVPEGAGASYTAKEICVNQDDASVDNDASNQIDENWMRNY